tara:strand:- start:28 stop:645 length:618 start_codon:yes stop_codon:yes gene_type:complete
MAVGQLTPEDYKAAQATMSGPIAGQSLTNDPDDPAPFEKAPQFTNVHEASIYLWEAITDEELYPKFMQAIDSGVPVMKLVQVILFNEFQKGMFNPDLMLMLAEPLAYMFIALAERLDLDIEIDGEEDEDEGVIGTAMQEDRLETLRKAAKSSGFIPQGFITEGMAAEMEQLPKIDSLLVAPEEAEAPIEPEAPQQPSLMASPEGQ